jgi:hypothetical protein
MFALNLSLIHVIVAYLFGMIVGMIVGLTLAQNLITSWRKKEEENDPADWWKHGESE